MQFIAIKTPKLKAPQTNIFPIIDEYLPDVQEGDIIFVASKIVAIHQWRCVHTSETTKWELIEKEADKVICSDSVPGHDIHITIKNNILIPSAGIDESNADGRYILRPEDPSQFAKELTHYLQKKYAIKHLAVVITDSTTRILRKWTINQAIGMFGMYPSKNYIGEEDIFWRNLNFTHSNILDSITAMAGLYLWEGKEQTPLVIGRGIPNIQFTDKEMYQDIIVQADEDIYKPLLSVFDK